MQNFLLLLAIALVSVNAFRMNSRLVSPIRNRLMMAEESEKVTMSDADASEPFVPEAQQNQFFEPNKRVRLGRSKDEDGKSNVWSIEPRMEVVEDEEEEPNNFGIFGAVIGSALACLPLFLAFSKFFPDPNDF
jgi:hypothetical protein